LMVVIVAMPQAQLRIGQVKGIVAVPVPGVRRSLQVAAVVLACGVVLLPGMSDTNLLLAGTAATYAIVMLSLVLLTGYGGHVSLAQFSFAGVGALTYAKLDDPTVTGLLVSALAAALVGALVALPVLRLTGLYLALSTLAFGLLMDKLVFQASFAFGFNGSLSARRLSLFGWSITNDALYVIVMLLFFLGLGVGLLTLRRGRLGRILIAMRDSPAACGTLGLELRWFRVGLFATSAGVAGLAGALFAGLRGTISAQEFQVFASLPLLLLAVVAGVTSVSGAALGGFLLMLMPVAAADHPQLAGLVFVVIGFGAVALGRNPNGLASLAFTASRRVWARWGGSINPRLPLHRARKELVDA
jgi:branched-chain amino acid transport system permease protein